MIHNAIIVTSFHKELAEKAKKQADYMFCLKSDLLQSEINDYYTFFIPPDGSEDGSPESDAGVKMRRAFMDWVDAQAYEDGSNSICAVELFYDDRTIDYNAGVVRIA